MSLQLSLRREDRMVNMTECKTQCKVDGHRGFAHIVEQEYNSRFKVWYGCVSILCDKDNIQAASALGNQFANRQFQMKLEDGRSMTVYIKKLFAKAAFFCNKPSKARHFGSVDSRLLARTAFFQFARMRGVRFTLLLIEDSRGPST
jgi:hypothetical protein